MIKSERMRWAEHAACMRRDENAYKILAGNHSEDPITPWRNP